LAGRLGLALLPEHDQTRDDGGGSEQADGKGSHDISGGNLRFAFALRSRKRAVSEESRNGHGSTTIRGSSGGFDGMTRNVTSRLTLRCLRVEGSILGNPRNIGA
jgi:hypothetical protein